MDEFPQHLGGPGVDVTPIDLDQEIVIVGGKRLTERRARKIGKQMARRGRPSLTGAGVQSPKLTVRLPLQTKSKLAALAAEQHTTESKLARAAVDEYVERHAQHHAEV